MKNCHHNLSFYLSLPPDKRIPQWDEIAKAVKHALESELMLQDIRHWGIGAGWNSRDHCWYGPLVERREEGVFLIEASWSDQFKVWRLYSRLYLEPQINYWNKSVSAISIAERAVYDCRRLRKEIIRRKRSSLNAVHS